MSHMYCFTQFVHVSFGEDYFLASEDQVAAAAGCTLHQIASALYRRDPDKPSVIEGRGYTQGCIGYIKQGLDVYIKTIEGNSGYTANSTAQKDPARRMIQRWRCKTNIPWHRMEFFHHLNHGMNLFNPQMFANKEINS